MSEDFSHETRGGVETTIIRRISTSVGGTLGLIIKRRLDYSLFRAINDIRIPLLRELKKKP